MKIYKKTYNKIKSLVPILCVDCLLVKKNKCLLLNRLNFPAKGEWWFPGGRVFKNESIKEAAERKILSETSLDAKFQKIISVEETIFRQSKNVATSVHTVNICCYLVSKNTKKIKIDSDHSKYLWVDIETALNLNLHKAVINPLLKVLN